MELKLIRIIDDNDAIYGVLLVDRRPYCLTLEPSSTREKFGPIPPGQYQLRPFSGKKFKNCWVVTPTPGRIGILIHSGNYSEDTKGCILVGESFWLDNGIRGGLEVMDRLRKLLHEASLEIVVKY